MPGRDRVAVRAPGRVNLIGEHTDYNEGLCLPFAISRGVTVLAEAIDEDRIEAHAADLGETDEFDLDAIEPAPGWRAFVRGIAAELLADGHAVRGTRLVVAGDLPLGAGLSSSAALEAGLALALLAVAGDEEVVDRVALAHVCSRVERNWVGARTGLLDQLAVLLGAEGQALRLDLRDLDVRRVPLELRGFKLVTVDSGSRHTHAGGAYNLRREECRRACELLGIEALRDATLDDADELPEPLSRRVRHVVTEDERVDLTVAALEDGDLAEVGRLLDASHASLRDDFEVSVGEVEATVAALRNAGAVGARMVGGGFGGSVLALLPPGQEPPPGALDVAAGPGARLV